MMFALMTVIVTISYHRYYQFPEYLIDFVACKSKDIAELLGIKLTRSKDILNELIANGIVVAKGANRNRTYRLRVK